MILENKFTERSSTTLSYFSEVSKIPLLKDDEEVELAMKIRQGDEKAKNKLIKSNLRFVISVAKQFQNYGMSLDDLISEGNIGLIKAAERFDETRGFKFTSYAVWWIRQTILTAIYTNGSQIRLPYNKIGALNKINKMIAIFIQQNERTPTTNEIANETGYTLKVIADALEGQNISKPSSIDAVTSDDGFKLSDLIPDLESVEPDNKLTAKDVSKLMSRLLTILTPRESEILIKRNGLFNNDQLTLKETAIELNLTPERVRQIEIKALRILRVRGRNIIKSVFDIHM